MVVDERLVQREFWKGSALKQVSPWRKSANARRERLLAAALEEAGTNPV